MERHCRRQGFCFLVLVDQISQLLLWGPVPKAWTTSTAHAFCSMQSCSVPGSSNILQPAAHSGQQLPWKIPQVVLLQSASGETLSCEQLSSAHPRVDFWQIPKGEFPASSSGVCAYSVTSVVRLFGPLWTVAHQAPLSMEFSR